MVIIVIVVVVGSTPYISKFPVVCDLPSIPTRAICYRVPDRYDVGDVAVDVAAGDGGCCCCYYCDY